MILDYYYYYFYKAYIEDVVLRDEITWIPMLNCKMPSEIQVDKAAHEDGSVMADNGQAKKNSLRHLLRKEKVLIPTKSMNMKYEDLSALALLALSLSLLLRLRRRCLSIGIGAAEVVAMQQPCSGGSLAVSSPAPWPLAERCDKTNKYK